MPDQMCQMAPMLFLGLLLSNFVSRIIVEVTGTGHESRV